jgi:hypothetical protein
VASHKVQTEAEVQFKQPVETVEQLIHIASPTSLYPKVQVHIFPINTLKSEALHEVQTVLDEQVRQPTIRSPQASHDI